MTDIMWIIFYILEPTTMTPKETREYTFLYTRALFFSDLFVLVFVFVMFLVFEKTREVIFFERYLTFRKKF